MDVRVRQPGGIGSARSKVRGRWRALAVGVSVLAGLLLAQVSGSCGPSQPSGAQPSAGESGLEAGDWSATAPAESAGKTAPKADSPLVIFLGDSISAGLHLDPEQAFPAHLARLLAAEGLPFRLVNAGVSGDTTAGGLARVDWLLKQTPDVVVVELGGNDGLRGQPLESVESNLRGILTRVIDAGATAVLLGMDVPTSYGDEYAQGFRELYVRLARELEVTLVPFFMEGVGSVPELNLPDGIHPSPAGHERLAENLLPRLREVLKSLQQGT